MSARDARRDWQESRGRLVDKGVHRGLPPRPVRQLLRLHERLRPRAPDLLTAHRHEYALNPWRRWLGEHAVQVRSRCVEAGRRLQRVCGIRLVFICSWHAQLAQHVTSQRDVLESCGVRQQLGGRGTGRDCRLILGGERDD
jgi:hypothetical protein